MDTSSIIIGVVLMAIFIVPIAILAGRNSSKQKAKAALLNSFFEKEGVKVSEQESWGNHTIGINSDAGKLVFITFGKPENKTEVIDLHNARKCDVHEVVRKVDSMEITDIVGLKIGLKEPESTHQVLEFFNSEKRSQLTNEMVIAKTWAGYVNGAINKLAQKAKKLA
jgi:hypothetical protein